MFKPSAFESLLVLFFVASHCRGSSIRDTNNNKFKRGVLGGWRNNKKDTTTTTTTALEYHRDDKTENESADGRSDNRDSGALLSLRRPSRFNWEAFIHGPTGVASSNERSGPFSLTTASTKPNARGKPKKSRKAEIAASGSDQYQQLMSEEERLVVETSRRFVDTWSDFLCQGSISFGILSCRKHTGSTKKKKPKKKPKKIAKWLKKKNIRFVGNSTRSSSSSSLLPRFAPFPVSLLEFGTLVKSKVPYSDNHKGDGRGKNGRVVLCSWDIPLQGGALILEDGPSQQQQPQQQQQKQQKSRQSGTTSGRPRYRGRLVFAIAKIAQLPDDNDDPRDGSIQPCGNRYEILTGIREYRPFLAGGGYASNNASKERKPNDTLWDGLKANRETTTRRLCHAFYLSTQSMVHAYCTWRFHQAWREQLATAIQQRTETIAKDK